MMVELKEGTLIKSLNRHYNAPFYLVINQVWSKDDKFFWIVVLALDALHLLDHKDN